MSLTLITEPNEWQAAFPEKGGIVYNFQFTLTVTPAQRVFRAPVYNLNGRLALVFSSVTPPNISVGDRYFLGKEGSATLYQRKTVTIESIVASGNDLYIVLNVPFKTTDFPNPTPYYMHLYTVQYVESLVPVFTLFVGNTPTAFPLYSQDPAGNIRLDVSGVLQSVFSATPPVMGINPGLSQVYRLDYKEGQAGSTVTGKTRYALYSVTQPPNISTLPDWQFDLTTARCKQVSNANTGELEAQMKDANPCSPTYQQLRNSGDYFVKETNLTACPATYFSAAISRQSTLSRNNCGNGFTGTPWTIVVPAGAYTSTISQADANAQANAQASALDTQANANANGACSSSNVYLQLTATIINDPNFIGGVALEVLAQLKNPDNSLTTLNQDLPIDYYLIGFTTGQAPVGDLFMTIPAGSFQAYAPLLYGTQTGTVQALIHSYSQSFAGGRNIIFVNNQ